jgi:hypothetical protein
MYTFTNIQVVILLPLDGLYNAPSFWLGRQSRKQEETNGFELFQDFFSSSSSSFLLSFEAFVSGVKRTSPTLLMNVRELPPRRANSSLSLSLCLSYLFAFVQVFCPFFSEIFLEKNGQLVTGKLTHISLIFHDGKKKPSIVCFAMRNKPI